MNECQEIAERLMDWVEGETSGAEQARVAAHLQSCASCKQEAQLLQAMTRAIGELPELTAPRGAEQAIMARLRRAGQSKAPGARMPGWLSFFQTRPGFAAAAAAVLLIAVVSVGMLARTGGPRPQQMAAVASGVRLEMSSGSATVEGVAAAAGAALSEGGLLEVSQDFKGKLVYPDGSWVRVRAGAAVRVFSRSLALREGQVWLKVKKGGAGFQVETPQAVVAVRGTVFGVAHDGQQTSVQVEEGAVSVTSSRDSMLLEAGQSARVAVDLKITRGDFGTVFSLDRDDFTGKARKDGLPIEDGATGHSGQ